MHHRAPRDGLHRIGARACPCSYNCSMKILTISTGKIAPLFVSDEGTATPTRQVSSAIRKTAVSSLEKALPVQVDRLCIEGDEQANPSVHGGRDKAVYAFPVEHYAVWQTLRLQALKRDEVLPHGSFGENLTVEGLLETEVWIGDVLAIGTGEVRMRVTAPRSPCFKFNSVMGFRQASQMMNQSGYTGFYLEVMQGGMIRAGDRIELHPGARHMRVEELHRMSLRGPLGATQNKLF